jgi:hypothetical protein
MIGFEFVVGFLFERRCFRWDGLLQASGMGKQACMKSHYSERRGWVGSRVLLHVMMPAWLHRR